MKVTSINSCVVVKKYSIIEKDGKKYLALRIKNGLPETITGFDIKVRQYDKNGRSLGTLILSTSTLKDEDVDFVWVSKTSLHDKCDHCETEVKRVCYGDYAYTKNGDGVTLSYSDGVARARDARAFYLKSEDGSSQIKTHNYVKHAVGVGVLSVVLIIIALAVSIFQIQYVKLTAEEFVMSGVTYQFVSKDKKDDTDIVISGFNGRYTDVVIPEKIEGHRVTGIKAGAFAGSPYVRTLTIESSTLPLPKGVFANCENLTSVKLVGVKEIGENAFYNCSSLSSVEMTGVEIIGAKAFYRSGIESLDLSASEKVDIDIYAFSYCTSLKEVTLSQEVEFVGDANSFEASGVKSVEFGTLSPSLSLLTLFGGDNKVESISAAKLDKVPENFCIGMNKLKSFVIEELTDKNIGDFAFSGIETLETFDVGGPVTALGVKSFYNSGIRSIDLSNIRVIEESAFYNCRKLETVDFSASLQSIGDSAFYGCSSLKKVELPVSTKTIGDRAFAACSALMDIRIGDGIDTVGSGAFENSGITKLVFPDTIKTISPGALKNANSLVELKTPHFYKRDDPRTLSELFGGTIPTSLARVHVTLSSSINGEQFKGAYYIKEVILPDDITSIAAHAFENCLSLEKINMPAALNAIGPYAFSGCAALKEIEFPEGLQSVGEYAFAGCSAVTELTVPAGIEIEPCAFAGMNGLKSLLTYTVTVSTGEVGIFRLFASEHGDVPASLESVTLGVGDVIQDYTFSRLFSVKTIVVPPTVTSIGSYAFANCYNLENISLPHTVTSIGSGAFYNCYALTKFTVPIFLEELGEMVFNNCAITNLTIPERVKLRNSALYGMNSLESLVLFDMTVDGSAVSLGTLFGGIATASLHSVKINEMSEMAENAFAGFTGLRTVTIDADRSSLSYVSSYAFSECMSLVDVTLPSTVTSIGSYAFNNCYSLTAITLPTAVSEIGANAFKDCIGLSSIQLPKTLRTIGDYAFWGCSSMTGISIPQVSQTLTIGRSAFYSCGFESLTVPENVSLKQGALGGLSSITQLTLPSVKTENNIERFYALFGDAWYYVPVSLVKVTLTSATTLAERVFEDCYTLQAVELPSTLKQIGNYAFSGCSALSSVVISKGLNSIGDYAFYNCGNLSSITLPEELNSIGNNAFLFCFKLYFVYNYSKSIGKLTRGSAEHGYVACYALRIIENQNEKHTVVYVNGLGFTRDDDDNWYLIEYNGYGGDLILPNSITAGGTTVNSYSIMPRVFMDAQISRLVISKAVKKIGEDAFYHCQNLESIQFEAGCDVELDERVFSDCYRLVELTFGSGVSLGADYSYIFSGCSQLKSVTLPSMEHIGAYMFNACSSLTEVKLPDNLVSIGAYAFNGCGKITEIILPKTLNRIDSSAFYDCQKLYSVYNQSNLDIKEGDSNFGGVALYALRVSKTANEFNNSKLSADGYSFVQASDGTYYLIGSDKTDLVLDVKSKVTSYVVAPYAFYASGITSVKMTDAVTGIGANAFAFSQLHNIDIGKNVASIGEFAFYGVNTAVLIFRRNATISATNAFVAFGATNMYFKGTPEDWDKLNLAFTPRIMYYYVDCVHYGNEWTEINSEISTEISEKYEKIKKQPTCTETGVMAIKCKKCDEELSTYDIALVDHKFDEHGECSVCHSVIVTEKLGQSNFESMFTDISGFTCDKDGVINSSGNSAEMTFTFTQGGTLKFSVNLTNRGSRFAIYQGDRMVWQLLYTSDTVELSFEKNAVIKLVFYDNISDTVCTISDVSYTHITPGQGRQ